VDQKTFLQSDQPEEEEQEEQENHPSNEIGTGQDLFLFLLPIVVEVGREKEDCSPSEEYYYHYCSRCYCSNCCDNLVHVVVVLVLAILPRIDCFDCSGRSSDYFGGPRSDSELDWKTRETSATNQNDNRQDEDYRKTSLRVAGKRLVVVVYVMVVEYELGKKKGNIAVVVAVEEKQKNDEDGKQRLSVVVVQENKIAIVPAVEKNDTENKAAAVAVLHKRGARVHCPHVLERVDSLDLNSRWRFCCEFCFERSYGKKEDKKTNELP
jgi:hypothetical protein